MQLDDQHAGGRALGDGESGPALAAVARPGLRVDQIHKGHRWGVLVCEVCGDDLSLWSTPSMS